MPVEPTQEQLDEAHGHLYRSFMPTKSDVDELARLFAKRERARAWKATEGYRSIVAAAINAPKDCVDLIDFAQNMANENETLRKQVAAIDAYVPNWKTHNAQLERIEQLEKELALATKVIEHANTALKKV